MERSTSRRPLDPGKCEPGSCITGREDGQQGRKTLSQLSTAWIDTSQFRTTSGHSRTSGSNALSKEAFGEWGGGTESDSKSARRREHQIGFGSQRCVWRFRATNAACSGGEAIGRCGTGGGIGSLEAGTQDGSAEEGAGRTTHRTSPFHDRFVVGSHAVHRTTDSTAG